MIFQVVWRSSEQLLKKQLTSTLLLSERCARPLLKKHPDMIMPNDTCSLFWYVMHDGTSSTWSSSHKQEYDMNTKLNDKDIKSIADGGMKDEDMKLLVPHMFDMSKVKKEVGNIEDLEKLKKDSEPPHLI